jgi:hypothetical protein
VAHRELLIVVLQPTPAAPLKRYRPASPDAGLQPQPLSTRDLPLALWEDHLLPLLTCKEAGRMGRTCKALRGLACEHYGHRLIPPG